MNTATLQAERPAAPAADGLSDQNFRRLATVIQDYSGIKMPPAKRTMLEGRLRRRVRVLGLRDLADYCGLLFDDGGLDGELVHLIDAVTTNKTEFFREPLHFKYLTDNLLPSLAEPRRIKVWSAACSTGAEPYTLAMLLQEQAERVAGFDYAILCTDLCTDVLEKAQRGVYPAAMVEVTPPDLHRKYVMRARDVRRDEVRIAPVLRARLRLARLNLMDDSYPVDRDMDLIFCRNVLIYFDKPTQEAVLRRLCAHLRPGAHLFLGHSESVVGMDLPVDQVANTIFRKR